MKKVYNLRIECNAPKYSMTDEEFCKGLTEIIEDEFGEEMKYVTLKADRVDELEQTQKQKAIECLKEVKDNFIIYENGDGDTIIERGKNGLTFLEHIYNKIKELEKNNES